MSVELNPHIINRELFVKNLTNKSVEKHCEKRIITENDKSLIIKDKAALFLKRYNDARAFIYSVTKNSAARASADRDLAYRLEPQLSGITDFNKDILEAPKFGGIPDMTWWYSFCIDNAEMGDGRKTQTLDDSIKNHWPVCGCCHKPMWFLGQLDITVWSQVIHLMTFEKLNKSEDLYSQMSGLGSGNQVGLDSNVHDTWWFLFYCDCFNYGFQSSSAAVMLKNKFKGYGRTLKEIEKELSGDIDEKRKKYLEITRDMHAYDKEEGCLWPEKEYCKAVEKFMEENKIHPEMIDKTTCENPGKIPLQFIKDYEIRFDLDYREWLGDDLYDKIYYGTKKQAKELFGNNGTYQLFGRPRSQQTEPRYMCSFGYEGSGWKIHRMAPIINWDDSEHDMTRQMYGCFRCKDNQCDTVWSRMDHSCT